MDIKEIECIKAIEITCQKYIEGKIVGGIPQHFNSTNFISQVRMYLDYLENYVKETKKKK
jgi:hypothetical protein